MILPSTGLPDTHADTDDTARWGYIWPLFLGALLGTLIPGAVLLWWLRAGDLPWLF